MRLGLSVAAVILMLPVTAAAQTTPWGDPDLQGVWSNQTPVPLERPAALANKPFFTKEEAADVEKNALALTLKSVAGEIATSGEFNEIWLESAKGKVNRSLRTSLVVDPPDGKIPFTAEGRARWEATPHLITARITGKPLAADRPEDRSLQERCIAGDNLFVPSAFYNNYHQIVQAPGYVVIVSEAMHDARVVPLDRRPRLGTGIEQWLGDSRGWWEGKTLVVETTNFNDKRRFHGSTRDVRLVERFYPRRPRHDQLPPHRHRPEHVHEAVDARKHHVADRRGDLRSRLSRGKLRTRQHPGGWPGGGEALVRTRE